MRLSEARSSCDGLPTVVSGEGVDHSAPTERSCGEWLGGVVDKGSLGGSGGSRRTECGCPGHYTWPLILDRIRPTREGLVVSSANAQRARKHGRPGMSLDRVQKTWEQLGRDDPLWAILTDPERRHGRWDLDEFFTTGRQEVEDWMKQARESAPDLATGSALDFGCGVGRLTQALGDYFDQVVGVDIAEPMIDGARRLNRLGDRCRYVVNTESDLSLFESGDFDFVLCWIVLQHMPSEFALGYIGEFLRVLRPGGVLVFQLPRAYNPTTVVDRSMPDSAFRAAISAVVPPFVAPGAAVDLKVTVTNISDQAWSPDLHNQPLRLGNHWRSSNGVMVLLDDARAFLTEAVPPGGSTEIDIECRAPGDAGSYLLELDMVQEGVGWFGDRGSTVFSAPVTTRVPRFGRLRRSQSTAPAEPPEPELVMEMHTTPDTVVTELVERMGGKVLATRFWTREGYDDAAYWVRKR